MLISSGSLRVSPRRQSWLFCVFVDNVLMNNLNALNSPGMAVRNRLKGTERWNKFVEYTDTLVRWGVPRRLKEASRLVGACFPEGSEEVLPLSVIAREIRESLVLSNTMEVARRCPDAPDWLKADMDGVDVGCGRDADGGFQKDCYVVVDGEERDNPAWLRRQVLWAVEHFDVKPRREDAPSGVCWNLWFWGRQVGNGGDLIKMLASLYAKLPVDVSGVDGPRMDGGSEGGGQVSKERALAFVEGLRR